MIATGFPRPPSVRIAPTALAASVASTVIVSFTGSLELIAVIVTFVFPDLLIFEPTIKDGLS